MDHPALTRPHAYPSPEGGKAKLKQFLLCGTCVSRELAGNMGWGERKDGLRDEFICKNQVRSFDGVKSVRSS